ncbi:PD-(D/E)XK nuclease-like domain-containing protein [Subtercola sp. PAMC28395]|uniref:PD-(D/E)XK nuclease-like domain-containing protein n=1 Tax=Subtercola sp. PAMC28395 TaxID=2846775 RepID=UPI001C0E2D87|nr:PD-(D/E)XK nuclease-like domain-containing protein [Subtercola sp. PAMC28395]QWT24968.1 PD-(D/E)XK nuclease-like domain-containing protein [Subtercola sp. PAMC28395]
MTAGIVTDMSEADYHARPELSSTQARWLLDTPATYRHNKDNPQPHKVAFDLGTAVHTKVLGVGSNVLICPDDHLTPAGAISSKAATAAWLDEQRSNGLIVIGRQQAASVDAMAEAVLAHSGARALLESIGGREVSMFAEIDGVPMRARFDVYDGRSAADLKSARNASPGGFNKAVGNFGYHVQDRWYSEAHTAITGTELDVFKFIVVEPTAPYLVGFYDLDFMWEDDAKKKVSRARELYLQCTETGEWPGYPSMTLTPPTWAVWEDENEGEIQV